LTGCVNLTVRLESASRARLVVVVVDKLAGNFLAVVIRLNLTGSVELTVRLESAARVHLVLVVDKLAVASLTVI